MLSSQFHVYPDCGRMEYGLKLDPYGRVLPLARRVESAPIPGDTTIINKSGIDLPGVRHERSEEHTSELQSHSDLVCRLLLEKKKTEPETTHPVIYRPMMLVCRNVIRRSWRLTTA